MTVVLTFAIGIGANVAVFSVVSAVILRPLPVEDQERLVVMWEEDLDRDRHLFEVSFANFTDWRAIGRRA